ncbi:MAG: hypothetical protein QOH58_2152 [Thermoleophilaceae bacterium]|jgi:hypothetical protein|nr:hypothetical protein [Thermoleophilaceae bacterium]
MTSPAAIHPLTPGSPAYALAKIGAIGGLVALRMAMGRRQRRREEADAGHEDTSAPIERRPSPHPVSRKRRRGRRRR